MGVVAYSSLSGRKVGWGGRLLTFSAFRMGPYLRWALIRGWALIRINTLITILYVLSVTVLTWWVARPKMCCNWYRI